MTNDAIIHREDEYYYNDTPQEIIDTTILKVKEILEKQYPEHISFGDGAFTISRGSSQAMIIVRAFTQDEACVECIANVVTGAKISEDLMRFLLRKNSELHFGAFGLYFDNTITYSHTINGSSLDTKALKTVLDTVSIISDYYDDIIVNIAGGKRALDIIEDLELHNG